MFANIFTDRQTDRQTYLDIAKGIGIILVVMGHCTPDAASPQGISNHYHHIMHSVIYSFHMPLFFFISGYLMSKKIVGRKTKLEMIKKRFSRIMVPYFFVGLLYLPMKLLFNTFANKPYDIHELWKIIIGINPDGELWFLYSLFVITTVAIIVNYKISKLGLFILALLVVFSNIMVFQIVTNFCFFFFAGVYMRQNNPFFVYKVTVYQFATLLVLFIVFNYFLYIGFNQMFLLTSICGIVLTIKLSTYIERINFNFLSSVLSLMGMMSMDIYILSDIIKIPFRIILWNKLHLYNASFLICLFFALGGSIYISQRWIRKNKILSKLFLGM